MDKTLSLREAREILEVDSLADADKIKAQFRKLARKHHPDRGGDAHEFSRIREAYHALTTMSVDDVVAADIEAMIFDDMWESWLGAQDDDVQETIKEQLDELENEKI